MRLMRSIECVLIGSEGYTSELKSLFLSVLLAILTKIHVHGILITEHFGKSGVHEFEVAL